jgi:hypothetical protein
MGPEAGGADTVTRLVRWLETRPAGNRNFPLYYAAKIAAAQGLFDVTTREQFIDAARSGLRGGAREARRTLASDERAAAHDGQPPPFTVDRDREAT